MENLQLHTDPSSPVPPPLLPYFSLWLSKALPLQNLEPKLQGWGWALPPQPPQSYSHPRALPPGFPSTGRLFGTGHILGVLPTTPAELPELLQPGSPVAPLAFPSRELLLLLPRGAFRPAAEPLRRGPWSHVISSPPPPFPAAPRARPASLFLAKAEKRNVNQWGKGTRQFPGHSEGTGPPSQGCPLRHGAGVWRPQRLLGFALGFLI